MSDAGEGEKPDGVMAPSRDRLLDVHRHRLEALGDAGEKELDTAETDYDTIMQEVDGDIMGTVRYDVHLYDDCRHLVGNEGYADGATFMYLEFPHDRFLDGMEIVSKEDGERAGFLFCGYDDRNTIEVDPGDVSGDYESLTSGYSAVVILSSASKLPRNYTVIEQYDPETYLPPPA